jgi:hypothetical protein
MTYETEDEEKVYCMPYLETSIGKLRVNYCPVCGREIRNVKLTE